MRNDRRVVELNASLENLLAARLPGPGKLTYYTWHGEVVAVHTRTSWLSFGLQEFMGRPLWTTVSNSTNQKYRLLAFAPQISFSIQGTSWILAIHFRTRQFRWPISLANFAGQFRQPRTKRVREIESKLPQCLSFASDWKKGENFLLLIPGLIFACLNSGIASTRALMFTAPHETLIEIWPFPAITYLYLVGCFNSAMRCTHRK